MNPRVLAVGGAAAAIIAAGGVIFGVVAPSTRPTAVPANVSVPTISGTTSSGDTLSLQHGSWTQSPRSYSYQWQDCNSSGASCVDIGGATSQTYTLVSGDVGHTIRAKETAGNAKGTSPPATSAASAVVTGVLGLGTGGSLAQCSSSCTTPTWSTTGTAITTYDDAGQTRTVTRHIYYAIPNNLVMSDATHPVPLVVIFPDSCETDTATKLSSCFTGSTPDHAIYGWTQISAANRFMMVAIFAGQSSGYQAPPLYQTGVASTCGIDAASQCSQIPEVVSAIQWAEAHYQIDTSRIFAAGGSKGGSMANDVLCDTHTEPLLAGVSPTSSIVISSGTTNASPPAKAGGSCPALLQTGTFTPATPAPHTLMVDWVFSARDGSYGTACTNVPTVDGVSNSYCQNGGNDAAGEWIFTQDENATLVANPAFGCSNSTSTLNDGNGSVKVRTYAGCRANSANKVSVQVMDYATNPGCHAYGCNGFGGITYVASSQWNYWTTGSTTP